MELFVGIGEIGVSKNEHDIIRTYSLASCVGVVMYAPGIRTMAMAHMLLPSPSNQENDMSNKPAMYVNTGFDALLRVFRDRLGIPKDELQVSIFGGAKSKTCHYYDIGASNVMAAKAALKEHGMRAYRLETGGDYARTLTGYSRNGHVEVTPVRIGV